MEALALSNPLYDDGDLDDEEVLARRDGTLIERKCDALIEASLEDIGRYIFNAETSHAVRLQYLQFVNTIQKERRAQRVPTATVGGPAFAVQIVLPPGAAAPGSVTTVLATPMQGQVETPQAPIIEIDFDDLGLPPTPAHVRAAGERLALEVIA